MLTPVLVRQMAGRTGTTLLMQLLGTSPEVTFDRVYPFERAYMAYLLDARRALGAVPTGRGVSFAELFGGQLEGVAGLGYDPEVVDIVIADGVAVDPACLCTIWRGFSEVVRRSARASGAEGGGAASGAEGGAIVRRAAPARFYAEKAVNGANIGTSCPVVPLKAIRLVRDPRDVWASIDAFDLSRGFHGFGRAAGESRASYLWFLARDIRANLEQALPRHAETIVVRYEDLVTDLRGEAARIGEWLGVELDARTVTGDTERFRDHMTSAGAAESVGRWRKELPADEARFLWDALGGHLSGFGYEKG